MLTPVKTSVSLNNPLRRSRKFEFKISNLFNNLAKKVNSMLTFQKEYRDQHILHKFLNAFLHYLIICEKVTVKGHAICHI